MRVFATDAFIFIAHFKLSTWHSSWGCLIPWHSCLLLILNWTHDIHPEAVCYRGTHLKCSFWTERMSFILMVFATDALIFIVYFELNTWQSSWGWLLLVYSSLLPILNIVFIIRLSFILNKTLGTHWTSLTLNWTQSIHPDGVFYRGTHLYRSFLIWPHNIHPYGVCHRGTHFYCLFWTEHKIIILRVFATDALIFIANFELNT